MGEQIFAGFAGALGIKKETTWNQKATPPSRYLEIESETFEEARNWIDTQGIDGTRSRSKSRSAPTTIDPRGGFKIAGVKGADLLDLLELALGSQGTGTAFCADLLPSFTTVVLKGNQYSVFTGCVMSKLDFDASDADQALKLAAEAVAGALVIGTAPDLGTPSYANESPLVFAGSTISAGAASVVAKSFKLSLANKLDEQMFRNSRSRVALPVIGERELNGEIGLDWNDDNIAAFLTAWRADQYAALQAVFTNGVNVLTFACPTCRFPTEWAKVANKDALGTTAKFEARSSGPGARDEIQIFVHAV
jgi:hypothetical protein